MAVLYRKYRPQIFSEVLGQKYIIQTLKNQVAAGSVAHAYLFTGSRGIGKTSVARILAKAVNCQNIKDGEPCGSCAICKQIEAGQFLDLVEIDAASNTGVDNIRDLIDHVKFSPSLGKYKVFIIDEVHMLSKGAFNALLKTLEEPPKHAIFILATTEINKVPATIVSRTQRFDFKRFNTEEIMEMLEAALKGEKLKLPASVLKLIAENAEGGGRDALSLLDKVITLGEDASLEEVQQLLGITDFSLCHKLLDLILTGSLSEIPQFFESLLEKGTDFAIFNRDFLEYLRKVLIYQVTNGQLENSAKDHEDEIKQQASLAGPQELIFVTRLFLKSYKDLSISVRADIPLLLAALEAAQRKSAPTQGRSPDQSVGANQQKPVKQPVVTVNNQPEQAEYQSEKKEEPVEMGTADESLSAETITFEEVQVFWPNLIAGIKKLNGPVANLIRTCALEGVENGVVVVGVKFPFHKQNLDNQKNQQLIRQVLEKVSGKKLALKTRVITSAAAVEEKVTVNLSDALQVFGGELIE